MLNDSPWGIISRKDYQIKFSLTTSQLQEERVNINFVVLQYTRTEAKPSISQNNVFLSDLCAPSLVGKDMTACRLSDPQSIPIRPKVKIK